LVAGAVQAQLVEEIEDETDLVLLRAG